MGHKIRLGLVLFVAGGLQSSLTMTALPPVAEAAVPLPAVNSEIRLAHAKELIGKTYNKSLVRRTENTVGLEEFILSRTTAELPGPWKKYSKLIAHTVIHEANQSGMDPLFLLAVITRESRLNPAARGAHGEIGLMQLKPDTAEWIAKKAGLEWTGTEQLEDPVRNIQLGVAYMNLLRKRYDNHSLFYISAYNMGPTRLQRLLEQDQSPRIYARNVMSIYAVLYRELIRESVIRTQQSSQVRLAQAD